MQREFQGVQYYVPLTQVLTEMAGPNTGELNWEYWFSQQGTTKPVNPHGSDSLKTRREELLRTSHPELSRDWTLAKPRPGQQYRIIQNPQKPTLQQEVRNILQQAAGNLKKMPPELFEALLKTQMQGLWVHRDDNNGGSEEVFIKDGNRWLVFRKQYGHQNQKPTWGLDGIYP